MCVRLIRSIFTNHFQNFQKRNSKALRLLESASKLADCPGVNRPLVTTKSVQKCYPLGSIQLGCRCFASASRHNMSPYTENETNKQGKGVSRTLWLQTERAPFSELSNCGSLVIPTYKKSYSTLEFRL